MTEEQLYHLKEGDKITITAEFAGLSCFHDTVYLKLKGILHPVSIDLLLETGKKSDTHDIHRK